MSVVKHLLDKIVFTIGVIIFLQLPHFIDQYSQRIGGYAASKNQELKEYQKIAQSNFNGDLNNLINSFKRSNDQAVRETGENIESIQNEVLKLNHEVEKLESNSLFFRTVNFFKSFRVSLVKGTLKSFQPGVPLNLWSLIYGLFGGILFSIIFNTCIMIPKKILQKKPKPLMN